MYNQKNVLHMFIGVNAAPKTSGTVTYYGDLTDGQMAFLNPDNTAQSDITATDIFRVAVRNGTSLLYSPWIKRANITSSKTTNTVSPIQQVSYFGYNGSTGSMTAINSNDFILRIQFQSKMSTYANKMILKDAPFYSSAACTQRELAFGLMDSLKNNFSREPIPLIQFDLINSSATAAGYDFDHTMTIVKGLPVIAVATDLAYNTGTTAAVGDYIRIGATTTSAVGLTSNVYKIVSIDTLNITVDRAVTEPSGAYVTGSNYNQVIPAVTAVAGDYGIKFTGLSSTAYFIAEQFVPEFVKFNILPIGFAVADLVTYTTAPVEGKGTYVQVAETFAFAQGNWGKQIRAAVPPTFPAISPAVAGTQYNLATFSYYNDDTNYLSATPKSPGEVIIALADNTSNNNLVIAVLQTDTTHFTTAGFPDFT